MSKNRNQLPFGASSFLKDHDTINQLQIFNPNFSEVLADENIVGDFCKNYLAWIKDSKNNSLIGIDHFPFFAYSQGTSEAFDKFYIKNHTRRFRCFKGEYMYHQLAWRNSWPDWKFIEDSPLDSNDAVVISLPFSDTGNKHINHDTILKMCTELKIPVLIDCAYYSVSSDIKFDFTHECITDITFSLSKVFPVAHARIGMRLTKYDDDDILFVYQKSSYTNRIGATIGNLFLTNFNTDYIVNKYKDKQKSFCKILEVEPSNTILFGLGTSGWEMYSRGGSTNRLGLHNFLHLTEDEFKTELEKFKEI
jgi:hypothetical protein